MQYRVDWRRECDNEKEVERKLAILITTLHEGALHVDGSGGDGGRDVELASDGRLAFWECKAFADRLTPSRKRQVRHSLLTAAAHQPDVWYLVAPMKMTPQEMTWFENLKSDFPFIGGFLGSAWIDGRLAEHPSLLRSFQTVEEEVLRLAGQYNQEKAIPVNGLADVADRAASLNELANTLSPDYEIATRSAKGTTTVEVLPRRADTPPIYERLDVAFDMADPAAPDLSDRLARALQVGAADRIAIPGRFIRGLHMSPEGRRLKLPELPDSVTLLFEAQEVDLRLVMTISEPGAALPAASLAFHLKRRTVGNAGFTLEGTDITASMKVRITARRPNDSTEHEIQVEISPVKPVLPALPGTILGVARFRHALRSPNFVRLTINGESVGETSDLPEVPAPTQLRADTMLGAIEDLARVQSTLDQYFPMPLELTDSEVWKIRSLRRLLDGETVEQWERGTLGADVKADAAQDFLAQFPHRRFAIYARFEKAYVVISGETIVVGPIAYYSPTTEILGKRKLQKVRPGDPDGHVEFVSANGWYQARLIDQDEWQAEGATMSLATEDAPIFS